MKDHTCYQPTLQLFCSLFLTITQFSFPLSYCLVDITILYVSWLNCKEAGTKVGLDQLGPPVWVGSTRIDLDCLKS